MRNRQLIVHWLLANTAAIEVRRRDGKTYYVVVDAERSRRRRARCSPKCSASRRRRLRGGARAARDLRRALRSGAARRGGGARGRAAAAVVHRVRHAEADARARRSDGASWTSRCPIRGTSRPRCWSTRHGAEQRMQRLMISPPGSRAESAPTRCARARAPAGRPAVPFADLTESNPTRVGLPYPPTCWRRSGRPRACATIPQPFGLPAARAAVAADYDRRGAAVDPRSRRADREQQRKLLLLFKLLCDPGDSVLVPRRATRCSSYLTRLEGVRAAAYSLRVSRPLGDRPGDGRAALADTQRAASLVSAQQPDRLV